MQVPGALLSPSSKKKKKKKKINRKKVSYTFSRKNFSYISGNGTFWP